MIWTHFPHHWPYMKGIHRSGGSTSQKPVIRKAFPCAVSCECSSEKLLHPPQSRRRHQMETFSTLLALCVRNSSVTSEFPAQRPVTQSFDVFFDLHLNKRLSKQSWDWWFEMALRSLWHHCNGYSWFHSLLSAKTMQVSYRLIQKH